MLPNPAELLLNHREALKQEWHRRLRVEPPATSLGMPDILIYRMDDTLQQVDALLRDARSGDWPEQLPPPLGELRAACCCGRNPLTDYFVVGGAAIGVVLPPMSARDGTRIEQAWYLVAQREIALLCTICRRYGVAADPSGSPKSMPRFTTRSHLEEPWRSR